MKFTKPEMKIIYFDAEDIIVTSGGCQSDGSEFCQNDVANAPDSSDNVLN